MTDEQTQPADAGPLDVPVRRRCCGVMLAMCGSGGNWGDWRCQRCGMAYCQDCGAQINMNTMECTAYEASQGAD